MLIIAVTAFDKKSEVNTNAIKAGASDFWSKNPDASESLMAKIRGLLTVEQGDGEAKPVAKPESVVGVAGNTILSSSIQTIDDVQKRIKKFARTDATILLVGETGTGKGYFAKEMHALSLRRDKPFQILNCPQQTKETIVSELFGHEKGSFTGAERKRHGIASAAVGGTLFLDEIEALDLECQATILRFIDEKEIKPLGSDKSVVLDIRFIVATNRDLGEMVKAGKFREDLLSRLSGAIITIPPLRDRGAEEIERLARHFYRAFRNENSAKKGYSDVRVSDSVWKELARLPHTWPGNVRELQQLIQTTLLERGGKSVRLEDFTLHHKIFRAGFSLNGLIIQTQDVRPTLSYAEEEIVRLIQVAGCASRSDVEGALGLKPTASWKLLSRLHTKGVLRREGAGRNIKYYLEGSLSLITGTRP